MTDKRNPLFASAHTELERHQWGNFVEGDLNGVAMRQGGNGVVVVGCMACSIRLNTIPQFIQNLSQDVLPGIIDTVLKRTGIAES